MKRDAAELHHVHENGKADHDRARLQEQYPQERMHRFRRRFHADVIEPVEKGSQEKKNRDGHVIFGVF